jgi:hypothetical protein
MRRASVLLRFSTRSSATQPRGSRIPPLAALAAVLVVATSMPSLAAATVTTSCIPCRYLARKMNEIAAQMEKNTQKNTQEIKQVEERLRVASALLDEAWQREGDAATEITRLTWDPAQRNKRTHFDAATRKALDKYEKREKAARHDEDRYTKEVKSLKAQLETLRGVNVDLQDNYDTLKDELAACEKRYCPPTGPRSGNYVPPRSEAEPGGLGSGIAKVRNASTDCPPCQPIVIRINASVTALEGIYENLAEQEKALDRVAALEGEAADRSTRLDLQVKKIEGLPAKNPGRSSLDKVKARRDRARQDLDTALHQKLALDARISALRAQAQQLIDSVLADQPALAKCEKQCHPASGEGPKTAALVPGAGTSGGASAPVGGSLSGVVVASRPDEKGHDRLMLATPPTRKGATVDQVRITLPRRAARAAKAVELPTGWSMTRHGHDLILAGPPTSGGVPVKAQIDLGGEKAPSSVPVDILSGGKLIEHRDCPVTSLPSARAGGHVSSAEESAIAMPPAVAAGQTIAFSLLDPHLVPEWATAIVSDGTTPVAADLLPGGGYRYTVPEGWTVGNRVEVSFADPWGGTLLAVRGGSEVIPPPATTPMGPAIRAATPQVITGQGFCVCGWFPDDASRLGVSLSGVALGSPTSASPEMLTFTVPADTPAGAGQVTGDPAAGFGTGDRAAVEVLKVGGSIDRAKLLRGEATPVNLWVEGTDQPVSLRLVNRTPAIVSLEGGETQIVVTSGGAPNRVSRTLHAVSPGDFRLDYTLPNAKCPCTEGSQPRDTTSSTASTSPSGSPK